MTKKTFEKALEIQNEIARLKDQGCQLNTAINARIPLPKGAAETIYGDLVFNGLSVTMPESMVFRFMEQALDEISTRIGNLETHFNTL